MERGFDNHDKKTSQKVDNFYSMSKINERNFFVKNQISPQIVLGHADCCFENPAEENLPLVHKFIAECPKRNRDIVFEKKTLFLKLFPGHVKSSIDNSAENIPTMKPTVFCSVSGKA